MESYQAANVIFVAIILWTAIKNSGKTIDMYGAVRLSMSRPAKKE